MHIRFPFRPIRRPGFGFDGVAPLLLCSLVLMSLAATVHAHGVDYRVERGNAVVVHFSSHHDGAMVGAGFRVFSPDRQRIFVSGRTDTRGRAVFIPDAPGNWRLLMATEDGHGAEVEVVVDADQVAARAAHDPDPSAGPAMKTGRLSATAAGVGYLFGLGGLLALWRRRR
ncbi:MAG: hypothetical protein KGY48_03390 [Wenzhouxiangellaceae bacterium]|jgi:nickel transport protein|nr:hypothetical protein [Wenzhouxiangellaceae bacterium]MBS3824631.1 hypothetical protein [Wenzhouxiangellaceae bacterium]